MLLLEMVLARISVLLMKIYYKLTIRHHGDSSRALCIALGLSLFFCVLTWQGVISSVMSVALPCFCTVQIPALPILNFLGVAY
jgi:uncharacterized membrane-anchored protein